LLLRSFDGAQVRDHILSLHPFVFAGAIALLGLQALLINLRWVLVMGAAQANVSYPSALRILLVSLWFNLALPTVGSDIVRAWMLRKLGLGLGPAINGVLADRLAGLLAIAALIALGLPLLVWRTEDASAILAVSSLLVLSMIGTGVLLTLDLWPARALSLWPLGELARIGALVRYLLLSYPRRSMVLGAATGVHLTTIATCMLLARGLDAHLSVLDALIIVPPVIMLSALPISIGGWGIREGAMVAGLMLVGIAPAKALGLSILLGLATVAVGLCGGILWLLSEDRERPNREALEAALRVAPDQAGAAAGPASVTR
jgi:uncharacterized membrane protein YbhN (UPF0104 family)